MSKTLALNWKMNPKNKAEFLELARNYIDFSNVKPRGLIVIPPSIFIPEFNNSLSSCGLGIQDVSDEQSGAFTAQISAQMAKSIGCQYALIGHSETREYLNYSNQIVARKVQQAMNNELIPILCIGYQESTKESDLELNWQELKEQIEVGFSKVGDYQGELIVAYEPVWAIGTGKTATLELIEEVNKFIRKTLGAVLNQGQLANSKIFYGGSVNEQNILSLAESEVIDGFLVGGASLVPDKVQKMLEILSSLSL